jgi:hypothetical protein
MFDLGVFQQKCMLPFSEAIWQLAVGFLTHDVFLNLGIIFNFLEDGAGIEVEHRDNHSILNSIEIKRSQVLIHWSDGFTFFILQN